jgi:hypothetical protein
MPDLVYVPKQGERVRAFHPRRFGVVNHGTVVWVGRKYVLVDFGQLLGGSFRVSMRDVVGPS